MAQTGIIKIAVLGAESTGKSVLCEALAAHYQTVWVPEYAREYFNDSDIYNYTLGDLEKIAVKQLQLEKAAAKKAKRFLFCDTTLITLKIWAQLEFNIVPKIIEEGLKKADYDFYLLTNNDVNWQPDGQRQNKFSREMIFEMNLKEIKNTPTPYAIVSGIDNQRLKDVITIIDLKLTHR